MKYYITGRNLWTSCCLISCGQTSQRVKSRRLSAKNKQDPVPPIILRKMILPVLVFLSLKESDCCGCCDSERCGNRFAMFASILFAVIGFLGAGYSFVISAFSIQKGSKCLMDNNEWGYPFHNGDYLSDEDLWSKCREPKNVISWNLTLFSILLVTGGILMLLCAFQVVNGLLGTLCGDFQCCGCCGGDGPV
ncbi:transmembrane 4 L6 family member 4 isoform X1 [Rousettus aegyptiacus]|uniref:Transmembrane 4 L six family member 4 n=1 Tax=Rousettus aegyptiacus TaxID=9407 RepID=A0A7J8HXF7_ROUAE|nr:transmembrane 4 L6 family member 4 isoform X1 [Rousettus aegyptiacus]KAF6476559.1 hypothetical protein HJG63_019307 [Rousettus aegyptiacus]